IAVRTRLHAQNHLAREAFARNSGTRNHVNESHDCDSARAGRKLSAYDDREANPAFAGGRGGHAAGDYFDRRFGQMGDRQSIGDDCTSRKLHFGRLFRVDVAGPIKERWFTNRRLISGRFWKAPLLGLETAPYLYNAHTVLPATIVRTARPFSFHPS